ncbi:predicted protein [Sclerotinia sclerotiorum 1980 UF-70]|uniref:Uncharacterized protein n=2 Tax=Sclerotinia sclerotiorum (strain ATCC 18683 / 1980 / Ss-1) TaxID=665079 RepID=A7EH21_SCLS1|nr:predicted protein [Sclerotinia sclerotiorum 1980 UF-70]APA06773.1 hypothetical protein sscle_02g015430 [Sclerotinia sclerotiorum 1980 UF-70]EDO02137.1 predicted protein [Sclerotinia sclerotiorum 1980 UF-70]
MIDWTYIASVFEFRSPALSSFEARPQENERKRSPRLRAIGFKNPNVPPRTPTEPEIRVRD